MDSLDLMRMGLILGAPVVGGLSVFASRLDLAVLESQELPGS
jgi:hypothetical protein